MAVLLHEIGHIVVLTDYIGRMPKIRISWKGGIIIGYPHDYKDLTKGQYATVMLTGIIAGLFPFLFLSFYAGLICAGGYILTGCTSDLFNMFVELRK